MVYFLVIRRRAFPLTLKVQFNGIPNHELIFKHTIQQENTLKMYKTKYYRLRGAHILNAVEVKR